MLPKLSKELLGEALRFCVIGVLATALHYGIYLLLKSWMPTGLAFALGYATSFIFNYFLSAAFTFKSKTTVSNGIGFACSHAVNLGLQEGFLALFLRLGLSEALAPIPVYAICVPVNFLLVRFVFKKLG